MRRGLAVTAGWALIAALAAAPAGAGQAQAGRLALQWKDDGWRLTSVQDFDVPASDGPRVQGKAALLHYRRPDGPVLGALLIASTWSEAGMTMSGNCKGDHLVHVRTLPTDGFVTYGCAMTGPALTQAAARARALKRLVPAAAAAAMPLPARGHVVTVLVTTKQGGVVMIEGFVDPSFGSTDVPNGLRAELPAGTPAEVAAYTLLLTDLAVDAATSVFPKFTLPEVRPAAGAAPPSTRQ